jgi:hypothetical protein
MVKMRLVNDSITASLTKKIVELRVLPQQALQEFKALTPKRTGRARSNTSLQKETIVANYPYAERLDQGYSKQAPRGMTKPLGEWLRRKLDILIKRK